MARATTTDDIHWWQLCTIELCNIPDMNHIGEVMLCDLNGEGFDFTCPQRHDAVSNGCDGKSSDAIEETSHRDGVLNGHRWFYPPLRCCGGGLGNSLGGVDHGLYRVNSGHQIGAGVCVQTKGSGDPRNLPCGEE